MSRKLVYALMNIDMWTYVESFIRDHNLIDLSNIVAIPLISYFADAGAKDKKRREISIRVAWFGVFYTVFMMSMNIIFNIDEYINAIVGGCIFSFGFIVQYFIYSYEKRKGKWGS